MGSTYTATSNNSAQSVLPAFTTNIDSHHFKVHVAIDFGTDGIALAYSLSASKCSNHVRAYAEWAGKTYRPQYKPKSIILLDQHHTAIAFGKDAKHLYIATDNVKDKWLLFEQFKMSLYDHPSHHENHKKVALKDTLTAANGTQVASSVVFIAAFKYLQKKAKQYLQSNKHTRKVFQTLTANDYQWIITVPAIWNDSAKYKMREWTIRAGLVNPSIYNQCKIVYEPDCASLCIQYEMNGDNAQISHDRNLLACDEKTAATSSSNHTLNGGFERRFIKGEKYILLDAGGGTVDIAVHEILSENGEYGAKEVLAPSGGPYGSCYIDAYFVRLMQDIFGKTLMNDFKRRHANIYTELVDNFQTAKIAFYQQQTATHSVRMPLQFLTFVIDKLDDVEIEDVVANATVLGDFKSLVTLNDEYLCLSELCWMLLFDHVIDPIVRHVRKILSDDQVLRHCKYLCLVGGLSSSPYFQLKMREKFGARTKYNLRLIVPKRPILCVVEGAAYFGITPNYIKARRLRFTYCQLISYSESKAKRKGISAQHIAKYRVYDKYRKKWIVLHCLKVIARKNEEIYVGQIKRSRCPRSAPTRMHVLSYIYYSNRKNPNVAKDGYQLGTIATHFETQSESDMHCILEFHFDDTLIKTVFYAQSRPKNKAVAYIKNY